MLLCCCCLVALAVVIQVDGGTGLWYPSKLGKRFLRNAPHDEHGDVTTVGAWSGDIGSINWRAWQSLAGLDRAGVDVLAEMICRAHEEGVELHTSLRMATVPDADPSVSCHQIESKVRD
eukprot:SAG31_NODE_29355_length_396_cov_1.215488_1_plen_118_part_10